MEYRVETFSVLPNMTESAEIARELKDKIREHSAKTGVVGLGYVGLPLAMEMAHAGFQVTGIDLVKEKVDAVNSGVSYILDVASEVLRSMVGINRMRATQSLAAVEALDTVNICVPTPLRKNKDPDLSYVIAAIEAIRIHIRPGQLIILESTTYPGTTREVVLPILEESGLKVGQDFSLTPRSVSIRLIPPTRPATSPKLSAALLLSVLRSPLCFMTSLSKTSFRSPLPIAPKW
jgi:UDP-N-acetyl-D-glucosamine dehydrogenase